MRRAGSKRGCTGLLLLMMIAGGCAGGQHGGIGGTATLPTLDAIRRTRPVEVVETSTRPALRAHVLRIELPVDAPVEAAWEQVDTGGMDTAIRDAWLRNGIRVGVLDADAIDAFIRHMPPALATRNTLVLTDRPDPIALYRSPPLEHRIAVDLTVPPLTPSRRVLRNGHAQLLGRIAREEPLAAALDAEGDEPSQSTGHEAFDLELQLHHHLVKTTLQPRMPQEKLLDGRIFDELAINLRLTPDERVVVGLYRVPSVRDAPPREATEDAPASEADEVAVESGEEAVEPDAGDTEQPVPGTPSYEPLPPHFGRQLLTGRRLGRNVQVLLVITFDP